MFVRPKAKRFKVWTYDTYVKREKIVFAQSDYKNCPHGRTDYHQNPMERPRTLDPTEWKHAIRHLKQRLLETKQPTFRITKLNTSHSSASAWITNPQLIINATPKKVVVGTAIKINLKKSWSLLVQEIEKTYDDKY